MGSEMCIRDSTLIEMLIAMVVIAVVGISISSAIGNVAQQTFSLERRTVAHWVAQNHVYRIRLRKYNDTQSLKEVSEYSRAYMANRDWELQTKLEDTQIPTLKRVEVKVYELNKTGDLGGPFDRTIAFIGAN